MADELFYQETCRLEMVDLAVLFSIINVRSAIMHYCSSYCGLTALFSLRDCRAGYGGSSGFEFAIHLRWRRNEKLRLESCMFSQEAGGLGDA